MPSLVPNVMEFALVSIDGEPVALRPDYGAFRIIEKDGDITLLVRPCYETEWKEPKPADIEQFARIVKKYGGADRK